MPGNGLNGPIASLVVTFFCKTVSASPASLSGGSGIFFTTCSRKKAPCGLAGGCMLRNAGDTSNLTAFAGYSFLYLSSVARPGDQIDRSVNPTLIPTNPSFGVPFGPPRPAPIFNHTDFHAHGVNLGLGLAF